MGMGAFSGISHPTNLRWPRLLCRSHLIIGAAIVTLAILNPLLCLLHCAHFSLVSDPLSDQQHQFLCGLAHDGEPTAAPITLDWGAPRAVYDLVPLVPATLALVTLILSILLVVRAWLPQHIAGPASPPPKLLLACYPNS